jgi:hypothetical protein
MVATLNDHLYSGKLWSEMDISDLRRLAEVGIPIEEIADILLREVEEVRQKATELNSAFNLSA